MPDDHQSKPQVAQTEFRIRSCEWDYSHCVKTDLVPDTGNPIEMIEHVASMIKANVSHSRRLPSVGELLCFELLVELPFASESL